MTSTVVRSPASSSLPSLPKSSPRSSVSGASIPRNGNALLLLHHKSGKPAPILASSVPPYLLSSLECELSMIALKQKHVHLDDMVRRSLLKLYNDMLEPSFKADISKTNKLEYLVMKFVACAEKEIVKIGIQSPDKDVSTVVFEQATVFVEIIIDLIKKDKDREWVVAKLQETKAALRPSNSARKPTEPEPNTSFAYLEPSFRISDMDQSIINLLMDAFEVSSQTLQLDVIKLKDFSSHKAYSKDLDQHLFYLAKDLSEINPSHFPTVKSYQLWKTRQEKRIAHLKSKYAVPASLKLISPPEMPPNENYYVFPKTATRLYYIKLVELILETIAKSDPDCFADPAKPTLPNATSKFLHIILRIWCIQPVSRATSYYVAMTRLSVLKETPRKDVDTASPEIRLVNVESTLKVFGLCEKIVERSQDEWLDRSLWSIEDQEDWAFCLCDSYNAIFASIKECLVTILDKTSKPKFGPLLILLGDKIESDPLFRKIEETGLPKKWEKRLNRALGRISEQRYATHLSKMPRDDTLNIVNVLDIADHLIGDVKVLQKRYKNPLLGFLPIARIYGHITIKTFAADAGNILNHIKSVADYKGEGIAYADAIEAYKTMGEIRNIYSQVAPDTDTFPFSLEDFFFPFLEDWALESAGRIRDIVLQAVTKDDLQPLNIEDDHKRYSSSVHDIFTMVREFFRILTSLNWQNVVQLASLQTILLMGVSDGTTAYSNFMAERITEALDEEERKKIAQELIEHREEKRQSGGWLSDVRNAVSNIQYGKQLELEEPYHFEPQTCISLNNFSGMKNHLTKLEDILVPEAILRTVAANRKDRQFTGHIITLRLVRAENLVVQSSSSSNLRPYVTLVDANAKKTIARTRTVNNTCNPDWDEEFEIRMEPNTVMTVSTTIWSEKLGSQSICGRALIQIDPDRFKHDGIPQEIFLDLDSQGRLLVEIAVENERLDALFAMGRAYRTLERSQNRCIKLIVQKFSRFIYLCFSRTTLKSVCGSNGMQTPTSDKLNEAMLPLYNYLNSNLQVFAEYATHDILMKIMLATWDVVVSSADELLLPKLASAKSLHMATLGQKGGSNNGNSAWQSAVTSAVANVTSTMGKLGYDQPLTNIEVETVFSWLDSLCFDFFHHDGHGPPIKDLKNQQYQSLLLIPAHYDHDVTHLKQEVDRLSPAFVQSLRDRNNFVSSPPLPSKLHLPSMTTRSGSVYRSKTIVANATAKARAIAEKEAQDAIHDPISTQILAEDILLRLLMAKNEKAFVARRLDQREKLAHSISTERLAKAAAEGRGL